MSRSRGWNLGSWALMCGLLAAVLGACGDDTSVTTASSIPAVATTADAVAADHAAAPVVIDTDLAVDSIMALLYLLGRPEVDVAAITVSGTGEVRCGPGAEIAAGLVALAGSSAIPVACGPGEPLTGSNAFPEDWRNAADDAWGLDLPAGEAPSSLAAPELLVSVLSSSEYPVLVFVEGPMTNLALALRLAPGIAEHISMVYVMGGAIEVPGNVTANPEAEWNIWVDPSAAAEVFASGVPITLVPLDATNQVPLEARHLRVLQEHQAAPAAAAAVAMLEPGVDRGLHFWDQLAAAVLVDNGLADFETMRLAVVTEGGAQAVGTTARDPEGAEVRVAMGVDAVRFEREFLSGLAGEDVGPVEEPPKTPVEGIEALAEALFAAAEEGDAVAWRALCATEARQSVYLVTAGSDPLLNSYAMADWDLGAAPLQGIEIVGGSLVSGDAVAIPVRDAAGEREGLIVVSGWREAAGVLAAGTVALFAQTGATADAAVVERLVTAFVAAWNAADVDALLSPMAEDATFWGNVAYPGDMAPASEVFNDAALAQAFSLNMEVMGQPLVSGPFAAVPLQVTDDAGEMAFGVVAVLWVRAEEIALLAMAKGGP